MSDIRGRVHSIDGSPIEDVLVMGAGLNYCETDADGYFYLERHDGALFFWCIGYFPKVRVLGGLEQNLEIVMRAAVAPQLTRNEPGT